MAYHDVDLSSDARDETVAGAGGCTDTPVPLICATIARYNLTAN